MEIDYSKLPTPCYIIDEQLLIKNLEILKRIQDKTGCKILLAQKGYSMYSAYPLISKYLKGTTASSLHEARLGYEEMGGEVHIYSPAYREDEIDEIIKISDHIIFNSPNQYNKFKDKILNSNRRIECGIRVNPEYSEVATEIYNPCARYSRLGTTLDKLTTKLPEGITGLHFHTMCEQNSDTLERTIEVIEDKFSKYFSQIKWLNMGGGHHITREDYDIDKLIEIVNYIKGKYNLDIYLEPGEAVALNTGVLVSRVLDIVQNGMNIAILDTSAACHMPDVIEMPYRPNVIGDDENNKYLYRLAGPSCLAGDIIGDYRFAKPLKEGDSVVFEDMAHYTMVKNNTFNGINLPTIILYKKDKSYEIIKTFGYNDFKSRL